MRVVLLGKPGSGKGTQARRIAKAKGIPQISTGDLIRAAIAAGSPLGLQFQEYADKGLLVPDDLVLALIEERLKQDDSTHGFLLDGFPRTIPQAEALAQWLIKAGMPLDAVLNMQVPDSALIERAEGRRFCGHCGSSFHVKFAPSKEDGVCDNCGHELKQRADDRADVVMNRVGVYKEKTAPLLDFYRSRQLLRDIDGLGTPQEVGDRIEVALKRNPGP